MVFKCQEDSFLKEFTGKVVSCEAAKISTKGAKEDLECYKVVLNDTILFPEGGGQPCDYGTLNDKPVRNVIRDGAQAVHFVETTEAFEIGQDVKQKVDWTRRQDHMQQHSGQHLITALFDREYGFDTKSWWLGSETSYVELNAKDVTKEQLDNVETSCNDLIAQGKKVSVAVVSKEKGMEFQDMRAPRGLPSDHVGPVRVITIEDIESNMCCGTHVSNLSQLQCVKLLHVEKAKGKLFVHFLVGNRVIKKLEDCYKREQQLNNILRGGPSDHCNLIEKIQTNFKNASKTSKKRLLEIAMLEAVKIDADYKLKYFVLDRRDGIEPDFISTFLREVTQQDIFYFCVVGDETNKGHMVLRGDVELIAKFGPKFVEILNGKGNLNKNTFQGKVNNLAKIPECVSLLKEHFES